MALVWAGWPSEAREAAGQPWVTARLLASAGLGIAKNQPIPWHHWQLSVKCQVCLEISYCFFFFFNHLQADSFLKPLYHAMLSLTIGLGRLVYILITSKNCSLLFFFFTKQSSSSCLPGAGWKQGKILPQSWTSFTAVLKVFGFGSLPGKVGCLVHLNLSWFFKGLFQPKHFYDVISWYDCYTSPL